MAIWCLQCFWIQLVCYLCYLKDLFWACWSFRMVRHVYLCIDDLWDFLVLCPDLMLILNCVLAVILSKTFIEALIVLYRIICSVCMHISYLLDHLSLLLTFCLMNKLNCIRLEWKLKKWHWCLAQSQSASKWWNVVEESLSRPDTPVIQA